MSRYTEYTRRKLQLKRRIHRLENKYNRPTHFSVPDIDLFITGLRKRINKASVDLTRHKLLGTLSPSGKVKHQRCVPRPVISADSAARIEAQYQRKLARIERRKAA